MAERNSPFPDHRLRGAGAPGGEPLPLLYEDEDLVAVNKPAWAVVHPTRGAKDALIVIRVLADQLGQQVFPLHRLDRQASGVLLLAKSAEVAQRLSWEFVEGRVRKRYFGLCRGVIEDYLRIDRPVPEQGMRRPSCTEVELLASFCRRYSLIHALPRSGRRHQIRYHLKHVQHPLVGDVLYGQGRINRFFRDTFALVRLFLHAEYLRIIHPRELRYLELSCPLAPELQAVVDRLRCYEGEVA